MQTKHRIFDDVAKVASGAASAFSGVREEVDGLIRQQIERVMADLNTVPRDEFEAVKAMAATARAENEALKSRVDALEAALAEQKK